MNEFQQRYAKLNRGQRLKVREDMIAEVIANLPMHLKGNSTVAQLRAAARKKVDMALSIARKMA